MKIGILTMNYAQNYGGVLQAYALSQYLKEQGHDVQVINYRNSGKNSLYSILAKLFERFSLKRGPKSSPIPKKTLSKKYLQNFVDFKSSKLKYTEQVDEFSISRVCSDLDVVIIGSDQIWNDVYTNRLVYYFDWTFSGKKIAYAACTILNTPPLVRRARIKKLLSSFDVLTVRDRSTASYVESLMASFPTRVVDPSCLYDYHDLISDNPIGEPYILTYILSGDIKGGNKNAINIIKQHTGNIPVVSVCIPSVSIASKEISDIFLDEATPSEWVNLFYHASFVYTDSFHGIMFSMKFKKPFIAYMKEGGRKSRLQDLVETYRINNIVSDVQQISDLSFDKIIDYDEVSPVLDQKVKKSKIILKQAIG